jgi:hypothetical protein
MPRKCVCVAVVAIFHPVCSGPSDRRRYESHCDQLVHHKISEPRLIAAAQRYYNAKRDPSLTDFTMQSHSPSDTKHSAKPTEQALLKRHYPLRYLW